MLLKSVIVPGRLSFPAICCSAFIVCILSFQSAAQGQPRTSNNLVPRVGTIKDYPATGLMTGCGNLYFYPESRASSSVEAYIFLASGDGSNAWMNLAGRDRRLQQIKSLTRSSRKLQRYYYRLGDLRISVVIEAFNEKDKLADQEDFTLKLKITLWRGRSMRTVRAFGNSDC